MGNGKELNHDLSALTQRAVSLQNIMLETRDVLFRSIEELPIPYIYEIIDANETVILCRVFQWVWLKIGQDDQQNKERTGLTKFVLIQIL